MKTAHIVNMDNGAVLASKAGVADNFFTRLKGLMGRKVLPEGEALIIYPCSMIHCLGMRINIDAVFVSRAGKVLKIISSMKPGQFSPYVRGARYVIELPDGQADKTGTKPGHCITLTN